MAELKLSAVLEAADPEKLAPHLAPFLGADAVPTVEMTRLQPPTCYWAVYEHRHRRATLKCFFDEQDYRDYRDKLAGYYPERVDDPAHPEGGLAFLPEVNGIIWSFPFDPVMPDLPRSMDPDWVAEVMRRPELELECKLIDYNPEIGAIVAYRRADDRRVVAFGKVSTEESCGLVYLVMDRLWRSPARAEGRIALPKPLGYRPRSGFLLQTRVRGRPIDSDRNSRAFLGLARAAGPTLATLHEVDVPFGPARPLSVLIERLEENLPEIGLTSPPLFVSMRRLAEQLRQRDAAGRPAEPVGCHGDFKYDQLLKYRRRYVLIDYEMFCQAEPWLDVGTFCAYLPSSSPDDWRDAAAAELCRAEFLRSYAAASGRGVDWDRFALYEAAMLGTRAMALTWGHRPGWDLRASALVDLALERLVAPQPLPQTPKQRRRHRLLTPR
jgi:hypothetical protein